MKKHVKKLLLVSILATLIIASALPAMGASDKVRVFVEFAPGAKGKVERALTSAGAEFHYTFDDLNSFVATIPGQAIKGLSNNPNVVDIEEDVPRYPVKSSLTPGSFAPAADTLDPNGQTIPWGIDAVQARDIWDADRDGNFDAGAPTGAGKTVCIIDTGFYSGHEDFLGVDLIGGTAQLDTPFSNDGNGHGTHVAGTIAAQNNAVGVVGVSPDVSLYIIKYFGDDGLATFASDLISASKTCAANGADVISMSLSGTRASNRERRNFDSLYADGVLSIGAASNDGGSAYHYPASYDSVVSVAALDESLAIADFSQFNDAVEIAAPGVAVLSTTPFIDTSTVTVDGVTYSGYHVEFSGRGTASGPLVDGGLCLTAGDWTGAVVLCERGDISFADKIFSVEDGGGVAALIYNNVAGEELYATMGDFSSSTVSIGFSQEIGQYLVANKLGAQADVSSEYTAPASSYEAWNGTSMATPHVSAVAALIWSANPDATNAEIREAITSTALDLGTAGRDVYFGYGLIQAKEALDFLGGGEPVNTAPTVSITSPADGATFDSGTSITFTGISSDVEDGSLNISWSSDQDGQLGTGDSVSAALTDGTHVITASVTDSGGLSASDEITVTVSGGGTGGQLYVTVVTDKPSYVDRERVLVTTTVTDGSAPVANANVAVTLTTGNGNVKEYSGITDANGEYSFTYRVFVRKDGSNTFTVVATATLTGYIEDSGSTSFTVQ